MAECLYHATDCVAAVPLERWDVEGVDAASDILQVGHMWVPRACAFLARQPVSLLAQVVPHWVLPISTVEIDHTLPCRPAPFIAVRRPAICCLDGGCLEF